MDTEATHTDKTYTVLSGGENTFDISRRLGITTAELMEHNDLSTYFVDAGTVLHLPYPKEDVTPAEMYQYTVYEQPKKFHIHNSTGSKKYMFGNVSSPKQIQPFGPTNKQYKEVWVAGEVNINFGEDDKGSIIYGYYFDQLAIRKDGKIDPVGYPMEYLTEGEAPDLTPLAPTISTVEDTLAEIKEKLEPDPEVVEDAVADFRSTYKLLPDGDMLCFPIRPLDIEDFAGQGDTTYGWSGRVMISGTFWHEDREYGRSKQSVGRGTWYGFEWDMMRPVEDIYEPDEKIDDKLDTDYEITMPVGARRTVYKGEELFRYAVAKPLAHSVKMMDMAKNKIKGKKIQ